MEDNRFSQSNKKRSTVSPISQPRLPSCCSTQLHSVAPRSTSLGNATIIPHLPVSVALPPSPGSLRSLSFSSAAGRLLQPAQSRRLYRCEKLALDNALAFPLPSAR